MSRPQLSRPRFSFDDHSSFFRDVLAMSAGGALGALAGWLLQINLGVLPAWLATLLVALPAGAAPGLARRDWKGALLGLAAGGIGTLLFHAVPARAPLLAGLLFGAALSAPLIALRQGARRWAGLLGCAALGMAAVLLTGGPAGAWPLGSLPDWAAQLAGGASFTFLVGYGSIVSRIGYTPVVRLPAARKLQALPEGVPESLRSFASEARQVREKIGTVLARRGSGDPELYRRVSLAADELAARVVEQIRRWHEVEQGIDPGAVERLTARLESLQERIERTEDETARQGFVSARDSLVAQLELHRQLGVGRERLHARLHQHVALMEKLHMTLVNLSSADAQRIAGEVQPLLDDLSELSQEVDILTEVSEALTALGRPA